MSIKSATRWKRFFEDLQSDGLSFMASHQSEVRLNFPYELDFSKQWPTGHMQPVPILRLVQSVVI